MKRKRKENDTPISDIWKIEAIPGLLSNPSIKEEVLTSKTEATERNSKTITLLEEIAEFDNLELAFKRVYANKGAAGIDGKTVYEAKEEFKSNIGQIRFAILTETYDPKPVKRVLIPKPDGGERKIGIPTVIDRTVQQAISQVLTPIFEEIFSEHSYGFREGRNCHQAIIKAREYIEEGNDYVVDIDLEKFFDTVNHDKLLNLVSKEIKDKRVIRLIRKFLKSGIMYSNEYETTEEGTPQGGNLSPLLSNIILHELDKELEKRGHKFCRYVDDCNIYSRSKKAGERIMTSISKFIEKKLKLKVNKEKSAVGSPYERKFLGFSFYKGKDGKTKIRIHPKSIKRLKEKIRKKLPKGNERNIKEAIQSLRNLQKGWYNYYGIQQYPSQMKTLDGWIRRHLRKLIWLSWKKPATKVRELVKLGMPLSEAIGSGNTRLGDWRIAGSQILHKTLTNKYLAKLGYISFESMDA